MGNEVSIARAGLQGARDVSRNAKTDGGDTCEPIQQTVSWTNCPTREFYDCVIPLDCVAQMAEPPDDRSPQWPNQAGAVFATMMSAHSYQLRFRVALN
jgi:hypothetical protein